jgi:hypothetical protein
MSPFALYFDEYNVGATKQRSCTVMWKSLLEEFQLFFRHAALKMGAKRSELPGATGDQCA